MALPIRALARALMPQYVRLGLSTRAVTRDLKKRFGSAYRRATLVSDYREFTGMLKHEYALRRLKPTTLIPKTLMVETELGQVRKYLLVGKGFFMDPETGDEIERNISWYTNKGNSKEGHEQEYKEKVERLTDQPDSWPYRIEIYAIKHHQDMPY